MEEKIVQKSFDVASIKPAKQKHNSKRRSRKKKSLTRFEDSSASSKIQEVVNYLCSHITESYSNAPKSTNIPYKAKEGRKVLNQCDYQNSKCSSSKNLPENFCSLLENFQISGSKNLMKSNNIVDFINIDLLKKNKCKSLSLDDLERLEKYKFNSEKRNCVSNENLKKHFNLNANHNSPGALVLGQTNTSSMQLVSQVEERSKQLMDLNVGILKPKENKIVTSLKSTRNILVEDLEEQMKTNVAEKNGKKIMKKKTRYKKKKEPSCENSKNLKVVFKETESAKACEYINNKNKQQSQKFSITNDFKYPVYLTLEELNVLSYLGLLLTGIIRINPKNYKEAYINAPDKGKDILIEGLKDRNRALEGDEVYFILSGKEYHRTSTESTDNTDIQRTAVIIGIKTYNHNRGAVGSLSVTNTKNKNFALFSPRDSRLPRIRIWKRNWPQGFSENPDGFKDKLYFVKIYQWDDLRYADGKIVKEVGTAGDLEAETDAILLKYGLDVTPYSENLKPIIPPSKYTISDFEVQNREDFRQDCIFTIDPKRAVDLDDAVSFKSLPNGNYEVGVHISDVSFYLEEGTLLDKAVCERATTIYLVQKAYHMLPLELCQMCSLTPGVDKLSFSVLWEVTPDYKIVKHRFSRSLINSCTQLSYEQVQIVIDNPSSMNFVNSKIHGKHTVEDIKKAIMFLNKMAVFLRQKRFDNGALKIEQKKIFFSLDEYNLPTGFTEEVHNPSHQLIEELMLLANITVAEKLNSSFPKLAFLRSHPPPLSYFLKKIQKTFESYGIMLNISSSGSIHSSLLNYYGDDTESVARMLVLNNALAKPMARAKYYCGAFFSEEIDRRHYALNVPLYTHFTSPIRRYADVMVHRLLAASLKYCDTPVWKPEYVQSIAANCNKQKYAAKMAQEMSIELYFTHFVGLMGSMICDAVVCDIKDKSLDCIGLKTGIHHRLYFERIAGNLIRDKEDGLIRLTVVWPKDEKHEREKIQIIEIFSIIKIELKRTSVLKMEAILLRD